MIVNNTQRSHGVEDPWLSIITVVRDDSAGLARTLSSLGPELEPGVEYIVIDSSEDSDDARRQIAGLRFDASRLAWTAPAGVYAAMNEGLKLADGTYVIFLNAGDEFANGAVHALREAAKGGHAIWGYGQVTFVDQSGVSKTPQPFDYQAERTALFARGRFPPHQGTFAQKSVLLMLGGFDTSYRIAADYKVFLQLSAMAEPVELDQVIARFHTGGLSSSAWPQSLKEFHRARMEVVTMDSKQRLSEGFHTAIHAGQFIVGRIKQRLQL